MKEGAFLPIRKPRDPGNEVAKYKQIERTHVYGIAKWQVILLQIPWEISYFATKIVKFFIGKASEHPTKTL